MLSHVNYKSMLICFFFIVKYVSLNKVTYLYDNILNAGIFTFVKSLIWKIRKSQIWSNYALKRYF